MSGPNAEYLKFLIFLFLGYSRNALPMAHFPNRSTRLSKMPSSRRLNPPAPSGMLSDRRRDITGSSHPPVDRHHRIADRPVIALKDVVLTEADVYEAAVLNIAFVSGISPPGNTGTDSVGETCTGWPFLAYLFSRSWNRLSHAGAWHRVDACTWPKGNS